MISFPHLHVPQRQTCYMQTCRTIFLSADYFCSVSKYFAISVWARTGGLARLGLLCLAGRSSGPGFSELCKHGLATPPSRGQQFWHQGHYYHF